MKRLFRIYLVVAVLFLLALAAVVVVNRVADDAYGRTAQAAELWSASADQIGTMDEGAAALNRPASQVLETGDVAAARADLERSVETFRRQLAPLFLDLKAVTSPAEQKQLAAAKYAITVATNEVIAACEQEFGRLEKHDEAGATASMIEVDIADDEVRQRLNQASHLARTIRRHSATKQRQGINAIHDVEHRAALLLLPLIFVLTLYGWRLVRAIDDQREREKLLQTVQESEERFQLVARATENVIWDFDLRTDMAWTNNAFQTKFGHPCGTIPARFGRSILHPEDHDRTLGTWRLLATARRRGRSSTGCGAPTARTPTSTSTAMWCATGTGPPSVWSERSPTSPSGGPWSVSRTTSSPSSATSCVRR